MPFIHPEVDAVQAEQVAAVEVAAKAAPAPEEKAAPEAKEPSKAPADAPAPAGEEQAKEPEAKVEAKPDTSSMARMLLRERSRKAEADKARAEKESLEKARAELASLKVFKEKAERWEQFEAAREAGDYNRVLEIIGTDLPRLNEAFLKGPDVKTQVSQLLRERDSAARAEQAKAAKEAEAARAQQEQEARSKILEQVSKDENCELINLAGAQGEVWELMRSTYEETGKLIPVADAAKQVEEYLEAQLMKTKRLGSRLAPKAAPASDEKAPAGRTLSSAMAPSSAGERKAKTEEERKAEAISWLRSQGMQ